MHAITFINGVSCKEWRAHLRPLLIPARLPLTALAGCATVLACDGASWYWMTAPLVLAGLFCFCRAWKMATTVIFLCGAIGGHHVHQQAQQREQLRLVALQSIVSVQARLCSSAEWTSRGWRAEVIIEDCSQPRFIGSRFQFYGQGDRPWMGQRLKSLVSIRAWPRIRNEGEWDQAAWQERRGVLGRMLSWQQHRLGQPIAWLAWSDWARQGFRQAVIAGLDPDSHAALIIQAIVTGQLPQQQDALIRAFRDSGTLHVFSVSGQHVNLVALLLWWLLRQCRVPRRHAIFILIPAVFAYTWLTGASAPALRAAWMAALFLLAFLVQRRSSLWNVWAVVLLASLLLNAQWLFQPGVQLSFGVVAAIAVGNQLLKGWIGNLSVVDPYIPRELHTPWQERMTSFYQRCASSVAISAVAMLGSAPLTILHFSMWTPISIVANLFIVPLVGMMLSLGLLGAALQAVIPAIGHECNRLNAAIATQCETLAHDFANCPGGHLMVPWRRPPGDVIDIYDLPRGDGAVLVSTPHRQSLLDCGNFFSWRHIVSPALSQRGENPQLLLFSHAEAGHIGAAADHCQMFPPQQVILPVRASRSTGFRALQSYCGEARIPQMLATPTLQLEMSPSVTWQVQSSANPDQTLGLSDDRMTTYLLRFHGWKLLFLNDCGSEINELIQANTEQWRADVLIVGRHRHQDPLDETIIASIAPRAIIATHADFPAAERLPQPWVLLQRQQGRELFHQGECGMVRIRQRSENQLEITGYLNHQQVLLSR